MILIKNKEWYSLSCLLECAIMFVETKLQGTLDSIALPRSLLFGSRELARVTIKRLPQVSVWGFVFRGSGLSRSRGKGLGCKVQVFSFRNRATLSFPIVLLFSRRLGSRRCRSFWVSRLRVFEWCVLRSGDCMKPFIGAIPWFWFLVGCLWTWWCDLQRDLKPRPSIRTWSLNPQP